MCNDCNYILLQYFKPFIETDPLAELKKLVEPNDPLEVLKALAKKKNVQKKPRTVRYRHDSNGKRLYPFKGQKTKKTKKKTMQSCSSGISLLLLFYSLIIFCFIQKYIQNRKY